MCKQEKILTLNRLGFRQNLLTFTPLTHSTCAAYLFRFHMVSHCQLSKLCRQSSCLLFSIHRLLQNLQTTRMEHCSNGTMNQIMLWQSKQREPSKILIHSKISKQRHFIYCPIHTCRRVPYYKTPIIMTTQSVCWCKAGPTGKTPSNS